MNGNVQSIYIGKVVKRLLLVNNEDLREMYTIFHVPSPQGVKFWRFI